MVPTFGKRPLGKEWEKNTYSPKELQTELVRRRLKFWTNNRFITPTGVALVCGFNHPQGYLVAIDCDGETSWRQIIQINEHLEPKELNLLTPISKTSTESLCDRAQKYLPPTIAFTSGRKYRSQRLYLIPNSKAWEVKSRKIKTGKDEHLEFRGKNLASILPPSFHPEGRNYRWLPGCSPSERQIEIAPDWVIAQMLAKQEKTRKFNLPKEKYNHRYGVGRYAHLIPSIETNIQTALVLLEVIHPRFADDYHSWIQVGMALHSVSPILFKAWDTWSQLSPKYKPGECAYKWQSFNKTGITIRTLFRLANLS
ncbi:bifunctional DNA primase/polymerase [Tolypothrix sp. PCC 7601]|uniref:bifunctional DNA primase/polymerase n=1 Tax=Tolypothrix sp. PCC 7601 TaxID=1188 RepID=UPI0005F7B829|nr:PriCT-2 domain-containing protein [Tolypothrix sp. PCC 7601]UYD38287.1 bifunctional DNA primase/polymerase [Tolypothrix sp. PCC 7601]